MGASFRQKHKIDGSEGNRIPRAKLPSRQVLRRGPNWSPLSGWRAQNPKSAVSIFSIWILDIAMFAKVWILQEIY